MLSNRLKHNTKSIFNLNSTQKRAKKEIEDKVEFGSYPFENVSCQVCNSIKSRILSEKDRYGLHYTVRVCENCGLVYTSPRMVQDAYNNFYALEYRRLYSGREVPNLDNLKINEARGEKIYSYLEQFIKIKNRPVKVLEIGCSAGGILSYFKNAGCETLGVDLDANYIGYGREKLGLNLVEGTLRDVPSDFTPDIIIYSHVLEHILDIKAELLKLKSVCTKNTLLYIEVPGIKNIHASYNFNFLHYLQNAHTFHFSLTTLRNLMYKNDFKIIKGDEFIRSVFVKREEPESKEYFQNDFKEISSYLENTERAWNKKQFSFSVVKRKFYLFIKNILVKIRCRLLKWKHQSLP